MLEEPPAEPQAATPVPAPAPPSLMLPVALAVVALFLWTGFQAVYLVRERGALHAARANLETPYQESVKLRAQIESIARKTADLAAQGNQGAQTIVEELRKRTVKTRKTLQSIYGNQHPTERTIVEQRLHFLERKFEEFEANVNPYHVLPGLVLEVDITSVKRKRTTMMAMANVLNEFLYSVSKGFHDTAFAQFSRRRSTVRTDLAQTFEQVTD